VHLAPLEGKRTLQIGGSGTHAVKFLLAGAAESWLVTPMLGEAKLARALAEAFGVPAGLHEVVAVAEELPFPDGAFEAVYAGGAIHHTVTDLALPEIARVLRPGGRFAAVDPWRAPLYGIGTRVFGKREKGVHCQPLTRERVASFAGAFSRAEVRQHGPVTRYPMLALLKLGVEVTTSTMWRLNAIDEAAMRVVPRLRGAGGSAVLLGTR
jgi:SAM-dependent methyltransferase